MSDDTHRAMIEFLGTFPNLTSSPHELSDMSDGVALFEALSELAPDYFDPTTISRHLGDNWALKSSNLRKLVRNLEEYYHGALQKTADFRFNINSIAREGNVQEIQLLVELLAAAAVTCPQKSTYVSRIMSMTPEAQVEMKSVLETGLARLSDFQGTQNDSDEEDEDASEMIFDNDEKANESKNLFQSHYDHAPIADLEDKLAQVKQELASTKSQAAIAAEEAEKARSKLQAVVEDLQGRLVQRQDELIQVEEELQTTTAELEDAKSKLAELQDEKSRLMDDLDVANAKAQQLHKVEATLVAYKKKLEGVGVMNQQLNDLEDQSAEYIRQIMDLENEVKKSNALQKTVNNLQDQIAKLEKEKSINESASKSTAMEVAELKSQLSAAETVKRTLNEELAELRAKQEAMEELGALPSIDESVAKALREKVTRLEVENQRLQEQLQTGGVVHSAAVATADLSVLQNQVQRLEEQLANKEKEIAKICGDKDKLEAYTKRTLAKFQDKYLVALQECKAKLKEKQDKIEALENRSALERTAQKREERLLSSTIYELGMAMMQNRLKER